MRRNKQVNIDWGDDEALDGETVRTRMVLMDSMFGHRPGYAALNDAMITKRRAARDAYICDLSFAWDGRKRRREPEENYAEEAAAGSAADRREIADARRMAAYQAMCGRLADAWKSRPVDAAQPDVSSRPEELMRHHLPAEPDEPAAAQARRDRAWTAYKDQLSTAWMRGRTDPPEADVIERQGEQWRGGR